MNPLELEPQEIERVFERVCRFAREYVQSLDGRPITPKVSGAELQTKYAGGGLPEQGRGAEVLEELEQIANESRAQNGRFFGYVMGSAEPVGIAAEFAAAALAQNLTAWRSSPGGVTIERTVVSWLAEAIGCKGFSGSLTGGGSSANLMGLAMAREAKGPAVVYASDEVHMSIPKAVRLLGLGMERMRFIPAMADARFDVAALREQIARDVAKGERPMAIVATAGTVNTGVVDPLAELAAVAREHGAWFHVDGAYGALAAMVLPERFRGLSEADSLSLDCHKWLFQTMECGCLLFRDAAVARKAFTYTGDYAKSLEEDPIESFAFFEESLELSRRFRALKVWLSLEYHGFAAFRQAIKMNIEQTRWLEEELRRQPDFEVLGSGDLSAVCFRYVGEGSPKERDGFNQKILKRVQQRGVVYLSNATIRGTFCLRACIVNHRTTAEDMQRVVAEVRAAAREVREGATGGRVVPNPE